VRLSNGKRDKALSSVHKYIAVYMHAPPSVDQAIVSGGTSPNTQSSPAFQSYYRAGQSAGKCNKTGEKIFGRGADSQYQITGNKGDNATFVPKFVGGLSGFWGLLIRKVLTYFP